MRLIGLIAVIARALAAEMDEGILVFNDENFDEEIAKYDSILVEFYAPWW